MNSGDDFTGWDGLDILKDGWLYIDGAQYDHFVHLKQHDNGQWEIDELIRVKEKNGVVDDFLSWVFGFDSEQTKRDKLSRNMRKGACRKYSSALKQVIFCDSNEVFDRGTFRSIRGNLRADWHVGDVPHLGRTLFWGKNNALYSYDGKLAKRITDTPIARGLLTVLSDQERMFYAAKDGKSYELFFSNGQWQVLEMNVPNSQFFTKYFSFENSDNIYVFTRQGIHVWNNKKLSLFWETANHVALTGPMSPTYVSGLNGVLFTTSGKNFNTEKLYRLGQCPSLSKLDNK
jgi:hypothetical protein